MNIGVIILLVIVAIALILGLLGNYFYRVGIARQKKAFLNDSEDLPETDSDTANSRAWLNRQAMKSMTLRSEDGLMLCGQFLAAPVPTVNTAICVHGYSGKGRDMAFIAEWYYESLGYNVLIPDLRGHGESEGNYIGFGWHDRKDLLQWISRMINTIGPEAKIVLHGVSMGAGTVLMASGEPLPEQVKCIVSDCSYSSVRDELNYQIRRMYKLPSFPIIPTASLVCRLRSGYFFGEASAVKQVAKSTKPILFIHGTEDTFVPTEMVYPLHEAAPGEKGLFLVPGAGHGNAFWTDREGYTRQVSDFIKRYMG